MRFVGAKSGEELDAAYADADLFVLPSRAETYGMVVTEALARALPVLATDVGGVAEALGAAPPGSEAPNSEPSSGGAPNNEASAGDRPNNEASAGDRPNNNPRDAELPGRLIPPDDPHALAAALRDWLTDPALRARWRAAAHARRATLTGWDDTARRWNEVLLRWESSAPRG